MSHDNSVEDILQVLIVFCVESLELDFALLFPERHTLLRVLPVLVVLATSSEKESESLYKRVKINRLLNIFKVWFLLVEIHPSYYYNVWS
jgi:cytoplasmic FMR1 interacting protein